MFPGEIAEDTTYDVLFDEKFVGGVVVQGSSAKCNRILASGLINLTHGNRKNDQYRGSGSDGLHTVSTSSPSSFSNQRSSRSYAQV